MDQNSLCREPVELASLTEKAIYSHEGMSYLCSGGKGGSWSRPMCRAAHGILVLEGLAARVLMFQWTLKKLEEAGCMDRCRYYIISLFNHTDQSAGQDNVVQYKTTNDTSFKVSTCNGYWH